MAKIRSVYICSLIINTIEFFGFLKASEDNTSNIVSLHGSRLRLSCENTTNVTNETATCIWKYRDLHSQTDITIFNGRNSSKARIDFDLDETRCDLIIKDTWFTDAGFYECELVVGGENRRQNSTWLTVMETECSMNSTQSSPSSDSLLDGDSVSIECKVVYRGNLNPVMQWNSYNGNGVSLTIASMHTRRHISGCNETTSAVSIRVTSDQDGDQFKCSTFFDQTYFFQNQTNDIKDHTFSWISPKLNVLYGPMSVTVSPLISIYKVGDVIKCLVKSNLETEFHWTELNDNSTHYHGSSLVLNRGMVDGRIYKYRCTATSVLKGRNYSRSASSKEISFTVKGSPRHQMMLFLAGVPIVVTVLCLVLIIVLLAVRRTRQKEIESNQSIPVHKCDQRSVGKISGNSYSTKNEDVGSIRSEGYIFGGKKTQRPCPPCPSGDSQSTKSHKSPVTHTGSDGTVYMDLNTLGYPRNPGSHRVPGARGHPSFPPVSRKIKCDSDGLYAKVDHTQTILPIRSASEKINRY